MLSAFYRNNSANCRLDSTLYELKNKSFPLNVKVNSDSVNQVYRVGADIKMSIIIIIIFVSMGTNLRLDISIILEIT